jgi:hypothetical protein
MLVRRWNCDPFFIAKEVQQCLKDTCAHTQIRASTEFLTQHRNYLEQSGLRESRLHCINILLFSFKILLPNLKSLTSMRPYVLTIFKFLLQTISDGTSSLAHQIAVCCARALAILFWELLVFLVETMCGQSVDNASGVPFSRVHPLLIMESATNLCP